MLRVLILSIAQNIMTNDLKKTTNKQNIQFTTNNTLQKEVDTALSEVKPSKKAIDHKKNIYRTISLIGLASTLLFLDPANNPKNLCFCAAFLGLFIHEQIYAKNSKKIVDSSALINVIKEHPEHKPQYDELIHIQQNLSDIKKAELINFIALNIILGAAIFNKLSFQTASLAYTLACNTVDIYSTSKTKEIHQIIKSKLPKNISINSQKDHSHA